MRNKPFILALLYSFFLLTGRAYGLGEKTITLGAASNWELVEKRQGIVEASLIRPHPVLVLDGPAGPPAGYHEDEGSVDCYLSFDEGRPGNYADALRRYDVFTLPELASASAPWSRAGAGAALFSDRTSAEPLVLKPKRSALFAPGSHVRNFTIEFWIYPQNLETGEQIFSLFASKPDGRGGYINQRIQCAASKNRLNWTFTDFFFAPGERERKSLSLSGSQLLNRTWSHHLIRFNADIGLLEYLVDGSVEAIDYATSSGREGGEVYTPVIGDDCRLALGSRFTGMMDEFRVYRGYHEQPTLTKYPVQGGRAETRTLDLGNANSRLLRIEAFGGRTSSAQRSNTSATFRNEYAGGGALRFSDHSELRFFARMSNSPYRWNDVPWVPVNPGTELPETFRGRYMQIASDFYPSADGETSPYLSELKVIYSAGAPPAPPTQLMATAKDGAVELSWKASPSRDVGGYLVYYGNARGEYFGDHAILESAVCVSPINVGGRTQVRIEGLKNGVLYYFVVAAYNRLETPEAALDPGEFSRELAARPLRMVE